jgi:acyl-CoA reductase-like NAD-dependent aldehyde dehydrogenase
MIQLPILRYGTPYRSIDTNELSDITSGEPLARVSQANRGLIARDLLKASERRQQLAKLPVADLIEICKKAAALFHDGELLVDPIDAVTQTADDYVRTLSATTGMPRALCRANMEKIRYVLAEMETVLGGLTRGLDLTVLDRGVVEQDRRTVSYLGEADVLGVILPSNSPGVHSLWIPSIALKVPLALKPGSQEPWTPMRIAQALIAAGCPAEAIGFYPTDYSGSGEILLRSDRSMLFGDESTVRPWKHDHRVQLHGPGWSKVIFGGDAAAGWREHLDLLVTSIAQNGGRSCVNASGVWTPARGRELADALAQRMAAIEPLPLDDPQAAICGFSNPVVAHKISEFIDAKLRQEGATDLTAQYRAGDRVVEVGGCTFLRPTIVWCDDPAHPLAAAEFLFPFASVVQVPQEQLASKIGPTLVATVVSEDDAFRAELMRSRDVDRLNLGPLPTCSVVWDQPHEGNLFEHLYKQRAFQAA